MLDQNPKVCLLAFGGEFLSGCLRMQVCSVTKENFQPYRSTTLASWALMAINGISLLSTGQPLINELLTTTFICVMVWTSIAQYVFSVLETFKRVLGIEVFRIKPQSPISNKKKKPSGKRKSAWKHEWGRWKYFWIQISRLTRITDSLSNRYI